MKRINMLLAIATLALLGACGDDQGASKAPATTAAEPAAEPAAPPAAATPAAATPGAAGDSMPAMAADEDTVVYDPIDISKLSNDWWKQYSAGG